MVDCDCDCPAAAGVDWNQSQWIAPIAQFRLPRAARISGAVKVARALKFNREVQTGPTALGMGRDPVKPLLGPLSEPK